MIVPLFTGAAINTFAPEVLAIGGFTTALFKTGAISFIALACFCCGAQVNIRQAATPLLKGSALVAVKMAIGLAIGWTVNGIWGPAGVFGIAPLAIIPALTNTNGGLYIALSTEYGDATDVAAQTIMIINEGPFFTMFAFGATGMAEIPVLALFASIVPLLLGFALGNLDADFRTFFNRQDMLIPFMAFCVGAGMDLRTVATAGVPGVFLGLVCLFLCGLAGFYALRLVTGHYQAVGAAIGSTAGNAMATPMILAASDPSLLPYVQTATAQIAAAVIVTALLCPVLTAYLHRKYQKEIHTSA